MVLFFLFIFVWKIKSFFINDLLLEIFWYIEAFTINAVLLHDIFIVLILCVRACERACVPGAFLVSRIFICTLNSSGSPFFSDSRSYDPILFCGNPIYSTNTETFGF